jgi:hypothetical protein
MERSEALVVLNVQADSSREVVEKAFQRMVRRYPPEAFAEKFGLLRSAYEVLTNSSHQWLEFMQADTPSLTWLLPYVISNADNGQKSSQVLQQELFKNVALLSTEDDDFDDFSPFGDFDDIEDFKKMMEALGRLR